MSKEFIEKSYGKNSISIAARQEAQLRYLVTSDIQEDQVNSEYIKAWAERHYQTNDYFLNYVKSIFNTENFLLFFKFMRKPIPSSKLINNKIRPQLRRVFNAEDSDFKYEVSGIDSSDYMQILDVEKLNDELFDSYFTRHNSILVEELKADEINLPYRYLVDIDKVKSIKVDKDGNIIKIAFDASLYIDEKLQLGYMYIDGEKYSFYPKEKMDSPYEAIHDLGYCPAHFISKKAFGQDKIIKESIFTYIREELEEYNFLKTLQKMTEPNGAIPVITMLDVKEEDENSKDLSSNSPDGDSLEPNSEFMMSGQRPAIYSDNTPKGSGVLQSGSVLKVPVVVKQDDSIDVDVVTNLIKFNYMPVEALNYLKDRISEIERNIVSSIVGDVVESNEESKNELQIEKSISVLENTLNQLGGLISTIRTESDKSMLGLRYGINMVKQVFVFMGSDFFLDSQYLLYDALEKAPNSIERKNILTRINQNRFKSNKDQLGRQKLFYDLIPYVSDKDFEVARNNGTLDPINFEYQTRFNYWISKFEAIYGDILEYYKNLELEKYQKLLLINNLIVELIKSNTNANTESNSPEGD